MWLDKNTKDNQEPPEKCEKLGYTQTWKVLNPEFQYTFWNREKIDQLFDNPLLKRWREFYYNVLGVHIEKCDFARYAIMYIIGGVYIDLDFKCLKPIEPLLKGRELGLVWEPKENTLTGDQRKLFNGFLMSEAGHSIWPQFMDWIMLHYKGKGPLYVLQNTGPICFSRFAHSIDLKRNPDYFIDTHFILPLTLQRKPSSEHPKNAVELAYAITFWNEGSKWFHIYVKRKIIFIFSIILIVAGVSTAGVFTARLVRQNGLNKSK